MAELLEVKSLILDQTSGSGNRLIANPVFIPSLNFVMKVFFFRNSAEILLKNRRNLKESQGNWREDEKWARGQER